MNRQKVVKVIVIVAIAVALIVGLSMLKGKPATVTPAGS